MTSAHSYRAAIVDDEPLALEFLSEALRNKHGFEVQAYRDAASASSDLVLARPDVLFLDIRMPEVDGFELLRRLPGTAVPLVVFVTAHDEYAVRAFELAALDYLLKPFDETRLAMTVARLLMRLAESRSIVGSQLSAALEVFNQERTMLRKLPAWAPGEERAILVPLRSVYWIEAEGKKISAYARDGVFRLRGTLKDLESYLPASSFLRISRSAIVNVDQIVEIQRWFRGDLVAVFRNGGKVRTSAGFRDGLKQVLGVTS